MRLRQRIICWWIGHDWDESTGFKNYPVDGAICNRCLTQFHEIKRG